MDGFRLFLLGRRLMKIGDSAIPRVEGFHRLPSTVRSVLLDVMEHPDTSISEITARTGFPQSQVSWSVTRLRDGGALETTVDTSDRRRTLVRLAPRSEEQQGAAQIDGMLASALGTDDPADVADVITTLESLADRLTPATERPRGGFPGGFEAAYSGTPPWDIGRPQPAFQELADAGALRGRVLDVGCGTGEHTLMAAAIGLEATGVDAAPSAIAIAERKAHDRGLEARFLVGDALDLGGLGERFDTLLDSGLFHVFDDDDRVRYVASLAAATGAGSRYHMLCFSDREPPGFGPRRVTVEEIRAAFAEGWTLDAIEARRFAMVQNPEGARAWLVQATRT